MGRATVQPVRLCVHNHCIGHLYHLYKSHAIATNIRYLSVYKLCIGLIMSGYEPEGSIERASHDQTYLVHGRSRECGLTLTVCYLCSAEI